MVGKRNSSHQMKVNPHDLVLAINHYRLERLWLWHHWQLGSWHIMATPQSLAGTDNLQYWVWNSTEELGHRSLLDFSQLRIEHKANVEDSIT